MTKNENYDEFNKNEGDELIKKHFEKTVLTLKILMNNVNMMYYFEKLKVKIDELLAQKRPSLIHLEKIMIRCLKLY
jgi:hypothetical protein